MRILIDSNVLLDIFTQDPVWFDWSAETLARLGDSSSLCINPIIYAEVSLRFDRVEDLEEALSPSLLERLPLPWEAGFLAGKCFLAYRRRGGVRRSPLPDFYIGAHAAVAGMALVTRDAGRFETYFPSLQLIRP